MRFTTRDLLWLTVVVAMGAAWWIHARQYEWWDHYGPLLERQLNMYGWRVQYIEGGQPILIPPKGIGDETDSN